MAQEVTNAHRVGKLRVLIADDSLLVRTSLADACSKIPQVELVGQAKDGLETIELVRQLKPDVLTLDIFMPHLNGIEVLRRMEEERLKCVVIVLTTAAEGVYLSEFVRFGAKYFYNKGTEMEKVADLLQVLAQRS
jgi:DNA-binding NarL/FixJ family response regulator